MTSSERRVQRVRKALDPPGNAHDDLVILADLARRMGAGWPEPVAEAVWNALTTKSLRLRYPVGKGVALSRMRRFVPAGMFDKSFRKQFQLDGHVNTPNTEQPTVRNSAP